MRRRIALVVIVVCAAVVLRAGVAGGIGAPTSWGTQPTPNGADADFSDLSGISCPATNDCIAVGDAGLVFVGISPLAEHWNGTSWAVEATVDPSGAPYSELNAVSCPTATSCFAVGYYEDSSHVDAALAERWNGASWVIESTPSPTGAIDSQLNSVSCPTAASCFAVGFYENSSNVDLTLAEHWNGASWVIESTPNPTGALDNDLSSVSCLTITSCFAVGFSENASKVDVTLAERWNGASWSVEPTSNPTGALASVLQSVSCPATTSCLAVGYSEDSAEVDFALAAHWDGARWSVESAPTPSGGLTSYLDGVSCPSTSDCSAVGEYENGPDHEVTLAESWNEAGWAVQSTTNPDTYDQLEAVSCVASGACSAVGDSSVSPFEASTLAERLLQGFWLASANGSVFAAGDAPSFASVHVPSTDPVVGIAATADGEGYWLVTADGSVYTEGDAHYHGSLPGLGIGVDDIVAIAPTGDGGGYWMIGRDGGEFAFGDAHYHGSLPGLGIHVDNIVGMVATSNGGGYWLVGSDGGVFAFGDTHYVGSLPGLGVHVNDIRAMIPAPSRAGYVLVGADGGSFVLGSGVHYYGSLPGEHITVSDIVGLALTPDTDGYWFAGANGASYAFGDASNFAVSPSVADDLPVAAITGR
jgi:hypothetical protein